MQTVAALTVFGLVYFYIAVLLLPDHVAAVVIAFLNTFKGAHVLIRIAGVIRGSKYLVRAVHTNRIAILHSIHKEFSA